MDHAKLFASLSNFLDLEMMKSDGDEKVEQDAEIYKSLYRQFLEEDAHIDWNSWKHIDESAQKELKDIPAFDTKRKDVLEKVVVLKLNGGLGTTMGCNEAKSFITVRNGLSFLDFTIEQHKHLNKKYNSKIPLFLMNSFYTSKATAAKLKEKNQFDVICFEQSKCPRISKETLLPIENKKWGDDAWYPPGHGNIFESLLNTETLDMLISEGREIIFVSNIDNTGATLDLSIAQFMLDNDLEYIMECTQKTKNDIKGGTLIEIDGKFMHLEMPQVPKDHLDDFCSTRVFKIFNTNNIWVNLKAIKKYMPGIRSEIIVNHKKVRGTNVIQLETSIGGCIKNFEKAFCLLVERDRFRPVKRVEDLVLMQSNLFSLTQDYTLKANSAVLPEINLGSFYSKIQDKNIRMPYIPNLRYATSFTVAGNVSFGKDVKIKGDVALINNSNQQVHVLDSTCFDNRTETYENDALSDSD